MHFGSMARRSGRRWWWAFSGLIAGPALALALLGLRVAKLESLERTQQIREQHAQIARLADTTIGNTLSGLKTELSRYPGTEASVRYTVFVLESGGRLTFPVDKIYFEDPGKPNSHSRLQWSRATEQLNRTRAVR